MNGLSFLEAMVAALSLLAVSTVNCQPRIAHSQYVYKLPGSSNDSICLYASFEMSFDIFVDQIDPKPNQEPTPVHTTLPNNSVVSVSGECSDSDPYLLLSWLNNSLKMSFTKGGKNWELSELTFMFNLSSSDFNGTNYSGLQSFSTNTSDLFSRTFETNEYFYCKNCKTYEFGQYNESVCGLDCQPEFVQYMNKSYNSSIHMKKSVIFIGNPSSARKRLCLEDYIQLQEIIVPIAVGGVLALLLILIFVAYIIAYVRRRRREAQSQYEPVGDF